MLICRKRFGIRGLFAFSGSSNAGPVPCATPGSPGSLLGVFIITSRVPWVVPRLQKTASCSIQSATTGFIANIFPYRNRISLKEAFEGPEPYAGKLSRPVLRGLAPSNGGRLLGEGCYDSQRLRRTIAMLSRLAIGRETNVLVVGHFRNAIRSQHTRRNQLRHVTVILAMAFSTMAALLGIWTLLHFSGMLLAPASKGHKVVFTGCLLATVGGFGGLTWVVIERNWLWWMALAISGWMFGVWMLILSSVDPPLVRSRSDIGFFTNCRGDSS